MKIDGMKNILIFARSVKPSLGGFICVVKKIKEGLDYKVVGFMIDGALIGDIAGYIINKTGYQSILSTLIAK